MSFNQVIKGFSEIQKVSSRIKKEEIFLSLLEGPSADLVKEVLEYTYRPTWNYHLTVGEVTLWSVPEYSSNAISNFLWKSAKRTLDKCRDKSLPIADARLVIKQLFDAHSDVYVYWLSNIINRNLRIGLADKTIAKYVKGMLPNTSPMLCDVLDIEENRSYKDWYAEPKFDGLRAIVAVEDGEATVFSRSGKPMWNCDHICEEIKALGVDNVVYDGEFADPVSFKASISVLHTQKKHGKSKNVKFWAFDCLPIAHWKAQASDIPLETRKTMLKHVLKVRIENAQKLKGKPLEHIKFVPSTRLIHGTQEELRQILDLHVENGFEGIVVKKKGSVYEWKRTKTWLKLKPYFEADLKIVGIEEGKGSRKGKCGALIVEGWVTFRGKKWKVRTEVGSGLSAAQTKTFWDGFHNGTLVGRTVEVRFQEISDWQEDKKVYALKFARLLRMRPDKDKRR